MKFELEFHHQSDVPTVEGDYLIYNQCDGFHEVQAAFDDHGFFECFYTLGIASFNSDSYVAWAKLPDSAELYEAFADKPVDGMSAHAVTMQRLEKQDWA